MTIKNIFLPLMRETLNTLNKRRSWLEILKVDSNIDKMWLRESKAILDETLGPDVSD